MVGHTHVNLGYGGAYTCECRVDRVVRTVGWIVCLITTEYFPCLASSGHVMRTRSCTAPRLRRLDMAGDIMSGLSP